MLASTHVPTGAFFGAISGIMIGGDLKSTLISTFFGMVGSLAPDIDHPQSWLGRRLPFISEPISAVLGHRGFTHSLLAVVVAAVLLLFSLTGSFALQEITVAAIALLLGYLSHLLGDWATNSGIPLMWPSKRKFRSPVQFFTGGWEEQVFAIALWLCCAVIVFTSAEQ